MVEGIAREWVAIGGERRHGSEGGLDRLTELFLRRSTPAYVRSDNGVEFTARAVREYLSSLEVRTLYIERGSPLENG